MESLTPNHTLYRDYHLQFLGDNNYLKGRLLTLIDASFADPIQRKAFKDLVSQELDSHFNERTRDAIIHIFRDVTKGTTDELFQDYGMPCAPVSGKKKR